MLLNIFVIFGEKMCLLQLPQKVQVYELQKCGCNNSVPLWWILMKLLLCNIQYSHTLHKYLQNFRKFIWASTVTSMMTIKVCLTKREWQKISISNYKQRLAVISPESSYWELQEVVCSLLTPAPFNCLVSLFGLWQQSLCCWEQLSVPGYIDQK